jgi:syntaxin 7
MDTDPPDERSPLLSQQQHQQSHVLDIVNQEEVDFQTDLIAEREADIASIQRGVREVNTIFRDIGALVSEQGIQIDSVEENISNVASSTQGASKQLVAADAYQRKRRKWSCIVLVVLTVMLLVVVLIVVS